METKDFTENISVNRNFPLQKFLNLPEVPCQRNTEARLSKARKYLKHLRPEHCIVHLVRLTKDCTVAGKLYPKGMTFRNDGNTRAMNWEKQGSDFLPEKLVAITYDYEDLEDYQERVEVQLDDMPIPIMGYIDFRFKNKIVDLKTTTRMPSQPTEAQKRQMAFYSMAYPNDSVDLFFATPKEHKKMTINKKAFL